MLYVTTVHIELPCFYVNQTPCLVYNLHIFIKSFMILKITLFIFNALQLQKTLLLELHMSGGKDSTSIRMLHLMKMKMTLKVSLEWMWLCGLPFCYYVYNTFI
jgi:hypothetical protein